MKKKLNYFQQVIKTFKANFRLIVFAVCISAVVGLVFFQMTAFTFANYAPNLLAEITGMFLSNIFTLLIIDQYYRIQKEKEFSHTLEEFNRLLKKLFNVYKNHCGKVFDISHTLGNTEFLNQLLNQINLNQKESAEKPELIIKHNDFDFINSFEVMGNVLHSIIHILNILPGDFDIKDFLVSFEKINTTLLMLKRHFTHIENTNYNIFLNDLKYLTEQLLEIAKNENFKNI